MTDLDIENLSVTLSNIDLTKSNMTAPTIDIKPLDLLPEFDGTTHKLYRFITLAEDTLDTYWDQNSPGCLKNKFLLNSIIAKLKGRAEEIVAVSGAQTWPQIKNTLLTTFGDLRDENALLSDLIQTSQKLNEDTITYYYRVISILNHLTNYINLYEVSPAIRANKINTYNSQALRTLIVGLREPTQSMLRSLKPLNLAESLKHLTEDQNIRYMSRQTQHTSNPPNRPNFNSRQIPRYPQLTYHHQQQHQQNHPSNNFPRGPIPIQPRPPQPQRFPTNAQVFNRPNYSNNVNVWKPRNPNPNTQHPPTPMSTNSRNSFSPKLGTPMSVSTHNTSNMRPQFRPNYFKPKHNFISEELHNVEQNTPLHYKMEENPYDPDLQCSSLEHENYQYYDYSYENNHDPNYDPNETNFDPNLFEQSDEQSQNFRITQPLIEET